MCGDFLPCPLNSALDWCLVTRSLPQRQEHHALPVRSPGILKGMQIEDAFVSTKCVNMCDIYVYPIDWDVLPIHEWFEFIVNVDKYSNPIATLGTILFYTCYVDLFEVIFYFVPWEHHPDKHPFGRICFTFS